MKKKLLLLILLTFMVTGCNKSSNKNELNVLNWSSYIPDEVIVSFEDETGIYLVCFSSVDRCNCF